MAAPIFGRQRVVLHLLRQAKTGPTKVHLMKWLFLMGEETDVREHVPFYDFLPYRYGPFSFTVYQELERLEKAGLVTEDLHIAEGREHEVDEITDRLKPSVRDAATDTLAEYGDLGHDELIDNVYARYDWYASRSELRPPRARKEAPPAVFTTGYEGESIDAFLDKLLRTGIGRVVDVRKNAYSQKFGFSGGPLTSGCAATSASTTGTCRSWAFHRPCARTCLPARSGSGSSSATSASCCPGSPKRRTLPPTCFANEPQCCSASSTTPKTVTGAHWLPTWPPARGSTSRTSDGLAARTADHRQGVPKSERGPRRGSLHRRGDPRRPVQATVSDPVSRSGRLSAVQEVPVDQCRDAQGQGRRSSRNGPARPAYNLPWKLIS